MKEFDNMSVDDRRVVSAEEAREVLEYERKPDALGVIDGVRIWPDLAHTVVVQADQIAAVLALHHRVETPGFNDFCEGCYEAGGYDATTNYPCDTARALGVTA